MVSITIAGLAAMLALGVVLVFTSPNMTSAGHPGSGGGDHSGEPNPNTGVPSEEPSTAPPPTTAPPSPTPSETKTSDPGTPPDTGGNPWDRVMYTTGGSSVALTFDDGPDPTWTPKVLAKLRDRGIKATFCLIGKNAAAHPDLVADIVADGHTLCNHSWSHDLKLGTHSRADIKDDLQRTNDAIRKGAPGADIAYFRHPGGNWTNDAIDVADELGMKPLNWSVDPADWQKPPADKIADRVIGKTKNGSIVLMHDGGGDRSHTLEALDRILPDLSERFKLIALRH